MNEKITSRECIMQLIRTRMASRHAMQRLLRNSNAGITFEMLQIMSCLWSEQGVTQQTLAERTAKDKACLTSLMTNLERKDWFAGMKIRKTGATSWSISPKKEKNFTNGLPLSSRNITTVWKESWEKNRSS